MRSLVRYSLIALGLLALVITVAVFRPRLEQKVQAQSAPNNVKSKILVISAFRENGPAGTGDEFVEIFNPRNTNVTASSLSSDPNGPAQGIGVFSNSGNNGGTSANGVFLRCHIPGSAVIAGRRWYLCGGSQYSLNALGGNGGTVHTVPDRTIGTGNAVPGDIPNDAGLALLDIGTNIITGCTIGSLNCPTGFNYSTGTGLGNAVVFDKVGFRPYGPGAPSAPGAGYPSLAVNFCEGTCIQPVGDASTQTLAPGTPACPTAVGPGGEFAVIPGGAAGTPPNTVPICYGESGQYKIDRRRSSQQFDATAGNLHRDTDNNADDFILDAPNPSTGNVGLSITGVSAVSSVLGAAFPHSTAAPAIIGPPLFTQGTFDTGGQLAPRNAERRYNQDPAIANAQNNPLGTFILRLRYTAGAATTGARYRIDDLTTLCGGQAGTNGISSTVATQEARNLKGPDFSVPPATSPTPSCQGEGSDAGVFTAILKAVNHPQEVVVDSGNSTRTVLGSVLEDTSTAGPAQHQPLGGGSNSSWVATTATQATLTGNGVNGGTGSFAGSTLASGGTLRIAFKFGVVKSGRFKLLVGPEVATAATPVP